MGCQPIIICLNDNPRMTRYQVSNYRSAGHLISNIATMTRFSEEGKILIAGDLNARTGIAPDFIIDDEDKYLPLSEDYELDSNIFT